MTTVDLHSGQHSWDYSSEPPSHSITSTKRQRALVPDNWDDDDVEEEEQAPQTVWDAANKEAPMPEILRSATASTSTATPPPTTAFQPSLRILKRPSPSVTLSPSSPSPQQLETLAQKEARYQAARERIFGDEAVQDDGNSNGSTSKKSPQSSKGSSSTVKADSVIVSRHPTGPGSTDGSSPRGFGNRKQGKGRPNAT
jgi:hypothetical protein